MDAGTAPSDQRSPTNRPSVRPRRAGAVSLTAGIVFLLSLGVTGATSGSRQAVATGTVQDGVREVTVRAYAWGFSPRAIGVAPHEAVRFTVRSDDMNHGFAINELGLNLPLAPRQVVRSPAITVRLPPGRYTVHCSVFCGTGHAVMKAQLVVGDPGPAAASRWPWLVSLGMLSATVAVGAAIWLRDGRRASTTPASPRAPASEAARPAVDLLRIGVLRRLLRLRAFQFLVVLPTLAVVGVVLVSAAVGIDHPGLNFGTVVTWTGWWGLLLVSLLVVGRAWCLACPIGAVGEWLQRGSLWWRTAAGVGYELPWPRRLRSLGLATALFVVFMWLDSGYGIANSPRMTAGLIVILALGAAWVSLVFERRAFCRYLCPLAPFIGLGAMLAVLELRRRDPLTCRTRCTTKDCFRGNARQYGCPMGEFPASMETNVHCTLCTECVKSCPYDNIAVRLRLPGQDLWAARRARADEAYAAAAIVGLATVVPLATMTVLPVLRTWLSGVLPAGTPPHDPPRLVAVSLLFLGAVGAGVTLVYGFSGLAWWGSGSLAVPTRAVFVRYAYGLVPVAVFRMLADFVDSAIRAPGTLAVAWHALLRDFPFNRVVPERMAAVRGLDPVGVYLLQVLLLLAGLLLALHALRGMSLRLFQEPRAAIAAFVPMAGLALVLTLAGVWTLGAGLF